MQQCTFCGAYLAERSLTCSRCGREQLPNAQPARTEEIAGGQASMTQENADTRLTRDSQQLSRQFQPYYHPQSLPQDPQTPQSRVGQVSLQQRKGQKTSNANMGRKIALPKWIMAVIAALIIASGIGVFALTSHNSSSALEAGRAATHSAPSSNVTQNLNAANSSNSSNSSNTINTHPATTLKSTSSIPTCSGTTSSGHTGTFTFTGGIVGTITLSTFEACNSANTSCYVPCLYTSKNGDHTYFGKAQGKISGVTYQFEFFINPYSGPGTYTSTGNINVVLMRNNYEWESYGARSNHANIVVNANEKIGSIHATISMMSPEFNPTSVVIVTGNWS